MCVWSTDLFEGVSTQFAKLQAYADFLDPSWTPLHHLFGAPPAVRAQALMMDVHNFDEWKRDVCLTIVLDCNGQWSWDFGKIPMVPECLF